MSAFVVPASGGIVSVKGVAGAAVNDMAAADRGKPGRDIVVSKINQVTAGSDGAAPANNCDPQSQLEKVQQRIQQQVQQKLELRISQIIQQEVSQNVNLKNLQQQMQQIQQQIGQSAGQSAEVQRQVQQQQEIVNKQMQEQMKGIVVGAIGKASQQLPNAAKVANSVAAGLKPVASVAESLSSFVPSQGINMGSYGSKLKTIQTVSQACFV